MEEAELIRHAQQGDSSALASLLHMHYPMVVKYLTKVTFDPQLAEDLAQDTMIKCIHHIKMYNGRSKFSSWLITIATRLHIDEWRKRKREREWRQEEEVNRRIRWQAESMGNRWSSALEAIGALPQEMRTAIVLKHYYGYSLDDISEMTGVPLGTVKSRIHNGIRKLRKELGAHGETIGTG